MENEILEMLKELSDEMPDDVQINLLATGIIDSFDIVNIVSALEEHFSIELNAEDIVPENFCSVAMIAKLLGKYVC